MARRREDSNPAELERRLAAVEDELAVRNTITRYGLAADTNEVDAMLDLLDEEVEMTIDASWQMRGHEEARQLIEGPLHKSFESRCAHLMGAVAVEIDGEHAGASGYSVVVLAGAEGFAIERVSLNRWSLRKRAGHWLITGRRASLLGGNDANSHDLLRLGLGIAVAP